MVKSLATRREKKTFSKILKPWKPSKSISFAKFRSFLQLDKSERINPRRISTFLHVDHTIDRRAEKKTSHCCWKRGRTDSFHLSISHFWHISQNYSAIKPSWRSGRGWRGETENKRGGKGLGTGFAWLRSIILLFYLASCLRGKRRGEDSLLYAVTKNSRSRRR